MSVSVAALFDAVGLASAPAVQWGGRAEDVTPGVYVIAASSDADATVGPAQARFRAGTFDELLSRCPDLTLDGRRPTADELAERLASFWTAEPVLYVGKATSLRKRLSQYYRTPLGARAPHKGGWWLKTLAGLDGLFVHTATTVDVAAAENAETDMLCAFKRLSTTGARMPWANLRGCGELKAHGIRGAACGGPSGR